MKWVHLPSGRSSGRRSTESEKSSPGSGSRIIWCSFPVSRWMPSSPSGNLGAQHHCCRNASSRPISTIRPSVAIDQQRFARRTAAVHDAEVVLAPPRNFALTVDRDDGLATLRMARVERPTASRMTPSSRRSASSALTPSFGRFAVRPDAGGGAPSRARSPKRVSGSGWPSSGRSSLPERRSTPVPPAPAPGSAERIRRPAGCRPPHAGSRLQA